MPQDTFLSSARCGFQIFFTHFLRTKPTKKQRKKKNITSDQQRQGAQLIVRQICKTIRGHFPDLFDQVAQLVADPRQRKEYTLAEIVMAAVLMFLFREGSRNAFNGERRQETFIKNYERMFHLRMPHMDTVDAVLRMLGADQLGALKACLVGGLIEKKVFHKFRFLGKHFIIAIDGTGLYSYDEKHCEHCLHKTSSTGKVTYFHHVLEAKLVTSNGMAISLCTEWIANGTESQFDKQDCEHKAFKRLATKLKKAFPRLPICITADGLYPNQPFFDICNGNGWGFIVTLKDGNLPSLQEEISLLLPMASSAEHTQTNKNKTTVQAYRWINGLEHKRTALHWVECREETTTVAGQKSSQRFVHVTNMEVDRHTACLISGAGRLRWKIENEGFNAQKNGGYNIGHKYSRVSFQALMNYYQCLQIAHMISQLVEKSTDIVALARDGLGIAHLWKKTLMGFLSWIAIGEAELERAQNDRCQIRLAG